MDIFLSNELSAAFEHLDLIVYHNKCGVFFSILFLLLLLNWVPVTETHSMWAFVNYSFVKDILFIWRKTHLRLREPTQS